MLRIRRPSLVGSHCKQPRPRRGSSHVAWVTSEVVKQRPASKVRKPGSCRRTPPREALGRPRTLPYSQAGALASAEFVGEGVRTGGLGSILGRIMHAALQPVCELASLHMAFLRPVLCGRPGPGSVDCRPSCGDRRFHPAVRSMASPSAPCRSACRPQAIPYHTKFRRICPFSAALRAR
jgi:hypothetical protein